MKIEKIKDEKHSSLDDCQFEKYCGTKKNEITNERSIEKNLDHF